jgi:hypothetical protein
VVDTTAQFLVPDSPELPETDGTVVHHWVLSEDLLDEDAIDVPEAWMEIEPEQGGAMSPAPEAWMEIEPEQGGAMSPAPEALMELEPEQGGFMTPAPEALVEEPEQGGIMTPAPEAELEDTNMASASPALTN